MTEPRLLLLDEPSSGLDQHETRTLVRTLRDVQRERGTAMLLVEHDVEMVQDFTSRVFVLDFGTLIASGADRGGDERRRRPQGVPRRARRHRRHQGHGEPSPRGSPRHPTTPRARAQLRSRPCSSCATSKPATDRSGRCSGCRSRSPRATSSRCSARTAPGSPPSLGVVSGLIPITAGSVRFDGVEISGMKPWRIAPLGIVQAPEGRSVFSSLTVEENLTLDFRRNLGRRGVAAGLERGVRALPAARRAAQAAGRQPLRR